MGRLAHGKEETSRLIRFESQPASVHRAGWFVAILALESTLILATPGIYAHPGDEKKSDSTLVIDLPAPEGEVLQAVKVVSGDGIIHGSKIYTKEPILDGAESADSSDYFGKWQGGGQVFYKIRTDAIAPEHFKGSADVGTISIRYAVQGLSAVNTRLQIDAAFVRNGGHRVDPSDGTVETSEFREIQDRIRAIEYQKKKDAEGLKVRQAYDAATNGPDRKRADEVARFESAETSLKNLQQHLHDLRHELEVRPIAAGTELKSAPFHRATKFGTVEPSDELLVLIVTPYWYGIETTSGQHAWIARDQVESLP
jgi:hypothetical protein